ncbi:GGDEF domain-containing protein [Actinoplanes couchii]|uniref:GGDEF domain-containing protein n=1 Tax=Actinoplanes couchii TaxID=403638 RepID=A0ABQ3XS38_9ACTN|nr:GGDEF domain-containing protein [Actinoplanes couchii]MDR6318458.1 diguanylate cyclase (GGDEF)-like protein [Actinoplanes couchii]GID61215.1 hypothetical protein Aco03nite_096190 [Actinoplanes couchii]
MTLRLRVAVFAALAAAGLLQAVAAVVPPDARVLLVFGATAVVSAWGAWACLVRARSATGRVARAWRAGAVSGVMIAVAQAAAGPFMLLGINNGVTLLPVIASIVASTLQLGLLARPSRQPLARLTRLLDSVAVAAALSVLSWLWVVVPILPIAPELAPVVFGIAVMPYLLAAAWALVLVANTPGQRNGYAVHLLGCAAALRAAGAGLALHNQYAQQPVDHAGAAAIVTLPALLVVLATTQDVPEPEHTVRRAVSLFWTSVPYLPVLLSMIAIAGSLIANDRVSVLLLWTLLGVVAIAVGRQFISLVVIRLLVTELNAQRDNLQYLAHHDTLTGLTNRASFQERATALLAAARPDAMTAVMLLDLDGFKTVNDRYGHAAGDHVLISVGQRLTDTVRPSDAASRLGGDEFVILLSGITDTDDTATIATRVLEQLSEPITYHDTTLRIGASIGIAVVTSPTDSLDTVLHYADNALYAAKNAGKNTYREHYLLPEAVP